MVTFGHVCGPGSLAEILAAVHASPQVSSGVICIKVYQSRPNNGAVREYAAAVSVQAAPP